MPAAADGVPVGAAGGGTATASAAPSTIRQHAVIDVNQPMGSMSLSPAGRDVVLAAKIGLFVLDLDNPYEVPRFLAHRATWELSLIHI